jgi:hypothetical protein
LRRAHLFTAHYYMQKLYIFPFATYIFIYIIPCRLLFEYILSRQICSSEGKERVLLLLPLIIAALNAGERKFIIFVCALFAISLFVHECIYRVAITRGQTDTYYALEFLKIAFEVAGFLKANIYREVQFGYQKVHT